MSNLTFSISRFIFHISFCSLLFPVNCLAEESAAVTGLRRAIVLTDATMETSFTGTQSNLRMYDTYNISTNKGNGTADVWPYTAALEAHCSVLEALELLKDEEPELYAETHDRFVSRLSVLYKNMAFYLGTYKLNSYTQCQKQWTIYGVHRGNATGQATVTGIENVYDDQMWICRELVRAYRLTGDETYFKQATMLANYCIDGWDCCLDANGKEYGGISWGPGYNSKHSCSNGPLIQPLVWLADLYRTDGELENMTYYYIDADGKRTHKNVRHSDLYLEFAKKIYAWQKEKLLNKTDGVYYDMCGGVKGEIQYVTIGRFTYRDHVDIGNPGGTAYTYNTGTMLAGAAELYRATGEAVYQSDVNNLCLNSNKYFSKGRRISRVVYYDWPTDNVATSGFNTWFDDVLMRAYVDAVPYNTNNYATKSLESFLQNLNYAWENHLKENQLPIHLLDGWGDEVVTKGFHQFAFASELAMLAVWQYRQDHPDGVRAPFFESAPTQQSAGTTRAVYDLCGRRASAPFYRGAYVVGGKTVYLK